MAEHTEKTGEIDELEQAGRTTAPQSPYDFRDVMVGLAILVIGVLVTFGVPLAAL